MKTSEKIPISATHQKPNVEHKKYKWQKYETQMTKIRHKKQLISERRHGNGVRPTMKLLGEMKEEG